MLKSKAIKEYKSPSRWTLLFRVYIRNPFRRVVLVYSWFKNVLRYDFDWDGHYLLPIIKYKLERIETCLINGHAIQEPKDMKALKLAIKLADRLFKDEYDARGSNRMDAKFGNLKTWFEKCEDGNGSYFKSSRPLVITKEDKALELEFSRAQFELSTNRRARETKWFYMILAKYQCSWWD